MNKWCLNCLRDRIQQLEKLYKHKKVPDCEICKIQKNIGQKVAQMGFSETVTEQILEPLKKSPFEQQCRMELEAADGRGLESGET